MEKENTIMVKFNELLKLNEEKKIKLTETTISTAKSFGKIQQKLLFLGERSKVFAFIAKFLSRFYPQMMLLMFISHFVASFFVHPAICVLSLFGIALITYFFDFLYMAYCEDNKTVFKNKGLILYNDGGELMYHSLTTFFFMITMMMSVVGCGLQYLLGLETVNYIVLLIGFYIGISGITLRTLISSHDINTFVRNSLLCMKE